MPQTTLERTNRTVKPPSFWESLPILKVIQQHARARRVSPWALLGVMLAMVVTALPAEVVLPPIRGGYASLNLIVGVVGRSGQGKGSALSAAYELFQIIRMVRFQETNFGSGEGIAASFARPKKNDDGSLSCELHTDAVLFHAAEIDTLQSLLSRTGATLSAELRKLYSGEPLGFRNRSADSSLIVPAHQYRAAAIIGIQPERSGVLLDETAGGTAQRFLWFSAADPEAPESAPEPVEPITDWEPDLPAAHEKHGSKRVINVCHTAREQIEAAALANLRGEGDPLDGHALLTRLKVAAALSFLSQSPQGIVSDDDWRLAGLIMEHSDATRGHCLDELQRAAYAANSARARARGEAAIETDLRAADVAIAKARERILKRVDVEPVGAATIRKSMSPQIRDFFEVALEDLAREGIVTVSDIEYQGNKGQQIRLNTP